jgi:hypothetical protein
MYQLTSENEGPAYFNCTLKINKANLAMIGTETGERRLASDNPYSFTWKVVKTETLKEIQF